VAVSFVKVEKVDTVVMISLVWMEKQNPPIRYLAQPVLILGGMDCMFVVKGDFSGKVATVRTFGTQGSLSRLSTRKKVWKWVTMLLRYEKLGWKCDNNSKGQEKPSRITV
jgi:hypothetical protein